MGNWFSRLLGRGNRQLATSAQRSDTPDVTQAPTAPATLADLLAQGNKALAEGRTPQAIASYRAATDINPQSVDAYVNLGFALGEMGAMDQAADALEHALQIDSCHADALFILGMVRQSGGDLKTARSLFLRCQEADPLFKPVRGALCSAMLACGDLHEAEAAARQFVEESPQDVELLGILARSLVAQGRFEEALAIHGQSITLSPDNAGTWSDRGLVLHALRRLEEAKASLEKAIRLKPDFADAYSNLGVVLTSQRNYPQALVHIDRAIDLRPQFAQALHNRGQALSLLRRYEEAAETYTRLLALDPDAEMALGNLLWSRIYVCNWKDHEQLVLDVQKGVQEDRLVMEPWSFLAVIDSPSLQLRCATHYARARFPSSTPDPRIARPRIDGRPRVAYLSADFHDHATTYLMAEMFEKHDRSRFEFIGISFGPIASDAMRARIVGAFEQFVDVHGMSDAEVARLIRDMGVDIAVDLKGYTTDARPAILAMRPAPVQVNYLGYPGTLGAEHIDYIVADSQVIPFGDEEHYLEKVVRLPLCYQVNGSGRPPLSGPCARSEHGLPEIGFVYCCFNNNYKITPQVFTIWMRLLKRVAGSVLWLLGDTEQATGNLRREAQHAGIDPNRLIFAKRVDHASHLARHSLADLFLDTSPCNAHTTCSDALWAGLPMVTCVGKSFAGRVAGSLLNAVGLSELAVSDWATYEALAFELANDPRRLSRFRGHLVEQRSTSPLFDSAGFARQIEAAYEAMLTRRHSGASPVNFTVDPV